MRESVKILLNMMVFFGREEIKLLLEYATGSDNGDWKGISKEADFIVVILSSKRAPRNDYKGKNCKPTGFHTRKAAATCEMPCLVCRGLKIQDSACSRNAPAGF
ncbi:uncharacterized protein LOC120009249 [Tripterygium wilfordii]|uniref:uncharacterized protein LOC120009249 n=1 Tax=Tripterygium wilfordii TaxID=458696 RepID=UPI0018F82E37|nr:uncharacterized protein LOC120009249 [Tripterygium wilfordii]